MRLSGRKRKEGEVVKEEVERRKKHNGLGSLTPKVTMKIFSWNPRGLGNPQGVCTLRDLLTKEDPDVLFLQ